MSNKRLHTTASPPPLDFAPACHAAVSLVAPLRHLGSSATCCFCGARVREAQLVRPIWGPRPCPQGHLHRPLEVVVRCRSCADAERRLLKEDARAVAMVGAAAQVLDQHKPDPLPPHGLAPSSMARQPRKSMAVAAQGNLF